MNKILQERVIAFLEAADNLERAYSAMEDEFTANQNRAMLEAIAKIARCIAGSQ